MQTSEEMIKFRDYIENCLLNEGFRPERNNWNFSYNEYTIGDEKQVEVDESGYQTVSGYTLMLSEVHRRNGTKENVSFRFDIMKWNRSSRCGIVREKLVIRILEKSKIE